MPNQLLSPGWKGFVTDKARTELPADIAFRLKNVLPDIQGAPTVKRGGWAYAAADLNGLSSTSWISGLHWYVRPDTNDDHLLAVGETGKVYKIETYSPSGGSYVGDMTTNAPLRVRPYQTTGDSVLFFPTDTTTVYKYFWNSGASAYQLTSIGAFSSKFACTFEGFDVYGGAASTPKRLAFASNITFISGSTWDFPQKLVGCAALENLILAFADQDTYGLIGSVPPPGGDMRERTLFSGVGLFDPRSILQTSNFVIWANAQGVWRTDGNSLENLIERGGISSYWRDMVAGFKYADNWICTTGLYRGFLFVSVLDNNGVSKGTLLCDLATGLWIEATNINAAAFATRFGTAGTSTATGEEEMFFGRRSAARVGKVSGLWTPDATNSSDADGTAVIPTIETGFYRIDATQAKRIRRGWIDYDLRSASGSPALTIGHTETPDSQSYTTCPEAPEESTAIKRRKFSINRKAFGTAIKITQSAASDTTKFYGLEIDGHPLTESRI